MPRFLPFALRDLGILALTVGAWRLDAKLAAQDPATGPARAVGVATGLLTAFLGFATHEWGHLAGAVGSGGVVHEPERLSSPFLFFFDVEKSDRRAFLSMSYGGYAGTALATLAIAALVPKDRLSGRVALAAAALGGLVTLALEVPTTVSVARGGGFPSGGVYRGTPAGSAAAKSPPPDEPGREQRGVQDLPAPGSGERARAERRGAAPFTS